MSDDEKIDPEDKQWERSDERFWPREGDHVWRIVGQERGETSQKGIPNLTLYAVCLDDPNDLDPTLKPPTDVGLLSRIRCTLGEGGKRFFVQMVKGMQYKKLFNPFDDDDIEAIFYGRPFVANCKHEVVEGKYGTRIYTELNGLRPYTGEVNPDWEAIFETGINSWEEMMRKAAEKAAKRQSGSGGGYGGGSNRGNSGGGQRRDKPQGGGKTKSPYPF